MLEHAKKIIVEVNQNMPWVYGLTGTEINIRDVDMVVEGENPAVAAMGAGAPPTDVDRKVAEMIVKEIPNGACLQLGIGGMPNTVGSLIAESDLKDLGVHTEMYVDALAVIAKARKITSRISRIKNATPYLILSLPACAVFFCPFGIFISCLSCFML